MKIKYLLVTMCAALVMTNCSHEDGIMNSHQGNVHTLQATIEGGSRSAVTDGGAFSWTTGDEISVWDGDSYETYTYSGEDNKFNGSATSISGYAIYPSGTHGNVTENTLPKVNLKESYNHGSTNAIMLAKVEEGNNILSFKHLGGLMRFVVKNVPAAAGSFTFTANVSITGDFQVETVESANVIKSTTASNDNKSVSISYAAGQGGRTMTFYVPLPVGTYTGFTIALGEKTYEAASAVNTINRGTLLLMPTYSYSETGLTKENGHTIVLEDNEEAEVEVTSGEVVIDAPEASGASVTLNYTPEDAQATLSLSDGSDENASSSAESAATVNVTVPENAIVAKLDIDMPTMTVELNAENNSEVTYTEVIALTAQNTLKIGAGVKIGTLKIKGGNVRVADGKAITLIESEGVLSENVYVVFEADKPTNNNTNEKIIYLSANEAGLVVAEVSTLDALNDALGNAMIDKILLSGNIETSAPITIGRNVVIDGGNSYTLTYTGGDRAIDMPSDTENNTILNVTIQNLTVNCSATYCNRAINYNANGKLILDNVKVIGTPTTYALNFPGKSDKAQVDITNCQITGLIALNVWGEDMIINVTNSILTSVDNAEAENYAAITLNNDGTTSAEGTNITIKGGKIVAKDEKGDPSAAVSNLTATGVVTIDATTEVTGFVSKPVAVIYYEGYNEFYSETDLQAAIDRVIADNNGKIRLISDVTLESPLTIAQGGNVTIDLNGYTISQEKECTASYSMITNKGKLTITGSGTISFDDLGAGPTGVSWGTYLIRNEGDLVVSLDETGKLEHKGPRQFTGTGDPIAYVIDNYSAGTVEINGGTLSSPKSRSLRNFYTDGNVVINDGVFIGQIWMQQGNASGSGDHTDKIGSLIIKGGNFSPAGADGSSIFLTNHSADNVKLEVTGGTFNTKIGCNDANKAGVKGKVSGGKFKESAKTNTASALIATGYEFNLNETDNYYYLEKTQSGN